MAASLAIYIGTESVDIISLAGSFQHPNLASFARARLPQQSWWREQVRVEGPQAAAAPPQAGAAAPVAEGSDAETIARSMQAMLAKLGLPSAKVYAAIASESVVIRCFQMPNIPLHERRMAIAFEAKKYLPFKLEELVTDYQVVIRRSDSTLMRVMFFGVKKSSVSAYSALFQSTKLLPFCLEPAPLCLMRLVRQNGQLPPGQVVAILSMEHDSATISIARDDLLYLSRNVSILTSGESGEGTPAELLEALLNETRVSIDYYRRRFLGEPAVSKILLFGKPEDQTRIQELFRSLELPVDVGDPFRKMTGGKMAPPGLGVAIGLALRGLDNKPGGINLLPPEQRRATQTLLKPAAVQVALAAVLLSAWYGFSSADLGGLQQRIEASRSRQIRLEGLPSTAGLAQLREVRSQGTREKQLLNTFSGFAAKPSFLLVELSHVMPQETWLEYMLVKTLTDDPSKGGASHRWILRLVGNASSTSREVELEKINQFLGGLQDNSVFKRSFTKFSMDSVQRGVFQKEEITRFRLTCASKPEDMKLLTFEGGRAIRRIRP